MEADVTKVIVDPVCGVTVWPDTAAASREYGGTTYYFCSVECAASFDADPGRYAVTAAQG
jgi:P-type Cu+ transporter